MSGRSILAGAQVMSLAPETVLVPERIGFLHEDKAVALGRLIAVDGQRDPIKVSRLKKPVDGKEWKLVVGMHRLHGCALEGIEVLAFEVFGKPEDLVDLEASENLHRRPLGPIERAKFTAALVQAAQERIAREHGELDQYQRGAKARWDRVKHGEELAEGVLRDEAEDAYAKMSQAYGWEEVVGEALEMSRRTMHRDLSLYRLIIEPFPEFAEALSKHPVVGENASQLKAIAAVKDEALRRKVIEALLANPEIGADDAKIAAGLPGASAQATPVAHQKFYNQIIGGWDRLGNPERTQFLPKFAALLTPGQKRELRDQLIADVGLPTDAGEFEEGTLAWRIARGEKL